ncbi:MAG: acetyl-CoA carboxylase biotin carboxyl carrier protein [Alphaproteobacteria bacterium]|nr:acetyl-CoA carboxylase biotin carboxyl carrier protein [Alphaproteobacteria bacterium]
MIRKDPKEIDEGLVRQMAQLLTETGLTEIEYGGKDWHLRVARQQTAAAAAPTIVTPAPVHVASAAAVVTPDARSADRPGAIKAPMVGTVYLAPEPGAANFVRVGDKVREGQTIMIIEAMKVMNPIPAARAGTVTEIGVANGEPVEYGQLLAVVE